MRLHALMNTLLCLFLVTLQPANAFWGQLFGSDSDVDSSSGVDSSSITHLLSHQAASDIDQDVVPSGAQWYDEDGTPLFYSAWRAQDLAGHLSPEPSKRSTVLAHGARVACWPSTGGVWIKKADVVDMNFLGVDRLENTPRQYNQTAEDLFCTKLKLLGAEWWSLPPAFDKHRGRLGEAKYKCPTLEDCFEPDIKNEYLFAWPETETTACYILISRAMEADSKMLGGYHNAMDMEERCGVIEHLGGKVCCDKAACPDLAYLDWSFRDPGPDGCQPANFPSQDISVGESFDPKLDREVLRWANGFCERNGWQKV